MSDTEPTGNPVEGEAGGEAGMGNLPSPVTTSPLDRPVTITTFPDLSARTKDAQVTTPRAFAECLRDARAPDKASLTLFSTCSYGSKRTAAKALRHDNNIVELSAIVGDIDSGRVGIADAVAALNLANLCGIVVTSPSHTPAFPRLRIVCPLSDPLNRQRANASGFQMGDHHKLVSRLAGLFESGTIACESWNRSQSWYVGCPHDAPDHQVHLIDGVCLDLLSYLDQTARPRPSPPTKVRAPRGISRRRAEPIPASVVSEAGAEALMAPGTSLSTSLGSQSMDLDGDALPLWLCYRMLAQ